MNLSNKHTVVSQDSTTVSFSDESSGVTTHTTDQGDEVSIDWDAVDTVEITDRNVADQFGTDTFYQLKATVARPIKQPYMVDGEMYVFKKPSSELKKAAWSLDNKPWTMDHPNTDTGLIKSTRDIRGFWTEPSYDETSDSLEAYMNIPTSDEQAQKYVEDNTDVSVGFLNTLVPTDLYESEMDSEASVGDTAHIDGFQTDLYFDHVASVENGRCSGSQGCGIDDAHSHGSILSVQQSINTDMSEGAWVEWDSSGGTAYGKIDEIVREGCTSRGKGDMEVCAEEDDAAVVVEVYDDESGESKDEFVRHKMSELRQWSNPNTDESDMDMTPPKAAQENAQMALDAKEDTDNPNDCGTETGWRRANQLADGGEVSWDVISKMSQFARHESNSEQSDEEGRADCGWMMWKAWGGDEGVEWANRMMERKEETDMMTSYMNKEEQTSVNKQDVFYQRSDAMQRAKEIGCDEVHQMGDMYMPCVTHEEYAMMTDGACDKVADAEWTYDETIDIELTDSIQQSIPDEVTDSIDTTTILQTAQCIKLDKCDKEYSTETKQWFVDTADTLESLDSYADEANITNKSREETDYTENGKYFAISKEESTSEEPKYPINNCNDVKDAWNLRNHGDYSISVSTLEDRIKRKASELDCSDASKPWVDSQHNTDKSDSETNTMEIENMDLDEIVDSNDAVESLYTEREQLQETVDTIAETLGVEKDDSLVEVATDTAEMAEYGAEYKSEQIDSHVEAIMQFTDRYDEDSLREKKLSHLEEIRAVVEDAADSAATTPTVANADNVSEQTSVKQTGTVDSPWE